MGSDIEYVTVFRSAETDAENEAAQVYDRLAAAGLDAQVFGDDEPGVIEGSYEVRVPAPQSGEAERILSTPVVRQAADPGHGLDMETVFSGQGAASEMEAMAVRAVLDASGIPSTLVGAPQIPSLPFSVQVPKSLVEAAKAALAEAQAAGPEAAEAAEEAVSGPNS
jgi:hypothetical protein